MKKMMMTMVRLMTMMVFAKKKPRAEHPVCQFRLWKMPWCRWFWNYSEKSNAFSTVCKNYRPIVWQTCWHQINPMKRWKRNITKCVWNYSNMSARFAWTTTVFRKFWNNWQNATNCWWDSKGNCCAWRWRTRLNAKISWRNIPGTK